MTNLPFVLRGNYSRETNSAKNVLDRSGFAYRFETSDSAQPVTLVTLAGTICGLDAIRNFFGTEGETK